MAMEQAFKNLEMYIERVPYQHENGQTGYRYQLRGSIGDDDFEIHESGDKRKAEGVREFLKTHSPKKLHDLLRSSWRSSW